MIFSQFVQGLCCRCSWPYWSAIKPRLWLWLPWLLAKLTIHTQHCLSMIYLTRVHVQQVLHSCRYNDSGELSKRSHSSTVALRSSPCYFPIWYFWLMVKNPSFFQPTWQLLLRQITWLYDSAVKITRWKILALSWDVQVLALGRPNVRCCMRFECGFPIFINHVDKWSNSLQVHSHNLNPNNGEFWVFAW